MLQRTIVPKELAIYYYYTSLMHTVPELKKGEDFFHGLTVCFGKKNHTYNSCTCKRKRSLVALQVVLTHYGCYTPFMHLYQFQGAEVSEDLAGCFDTGLNIHIIHTISAARRRGCQVFCWFLVDRLLVFYTTLVQCACANRRGPGVFRVLQAALTSCYFYTPLMHTVPVADEVFEGLFVCLLVHSLLKVPATC